MPSAAERVYDEVRARIVRGDLVPGERLREEELAEQVGVSRTPVREALRRLSADGLIELTSNRGAQVAAWTEQDLEEIFGLRALLEGYGARAAAERVDDDTVTALRAMCERMDAAARARDLDTVAEVNQAFHARVLEVAGNRRLREAVGRLVETPLVHRTFHHYSQPDLRRSLEHHHELVAALAARDGGWAESVMRAHVLAARAALRA